MKRIVALFKKTHEKKEEHAYPSELESTYKVTKKTLGVGSFAVVKECVHRSTGQSFALKIILKKAIAGKRASHLYTHVTNTVVFPKARNICLVANWVTIHERDKQCQSLTPFNRYFETS